MAMTKKNYIIIAEIFNDNLDKDEERFFFNDFIHRLGDYFQLDNPTFNKQKFIDACYK